MSDKNGFNDAKEEKMGYTKGLNDAWDCARKLVYSRPQAEWDRLCEHFGIAPGRQCDIIMKVTASEAIAKMDEYEKMKQAEFNNIMDRLVSIHGISKIEKRIREIKENGMEPQNG